MMKSNLRAITLAAIMVLSAATTATTETLYVWSGGSHEGGYSSWATAANDIQSAIAALGTAGDDDYILIAPDTYSVAGTGGSVVSLSGGMLPNHAKLTLKSAMPPGVESGETIIDGNFENYGVYIDLSTVNDSRTLVFEGLVISNCHGATGGGIGFKSGAAYNADIEINNCRIVDNFSENNGGGIFAYTSSSSSGIKSILISDSVINDNEADTGDGGGVYFRSPYGTLSVINSEFRNNVATNNTTGQRGGAIYFYTGSDLDARQSFYAENSKFAGNIALSKDQASNSNVGGASVFFYYGGYTNIFRNCLFADNSGHRSNIQAQVYDNRAFLFDNCTFVNNTYTYNEINFRDSSGTSPATFHMRNSIIWGGSLGRVLSGAVGSGIPRAGSDLLIDHCCMAVDWNGQSSGAGDPVLGSDNITANPMLDADHEYRLLPVSPCIDAGANLEWMADATDLDGRARIDRVSRIADIGAYEYSHPGLFFIVR